MSDRSNNDDRESRRIIERVNAESEARMRPSHKDGSGGEADGDDWAEFWGKRIGRVLSFVLLAVAVIWIFQLLSQAD